jgi:hypothetical protein
MSNTKTGADNVADEKDDIRSLLESAVAGETAPPEIAPAPELEGEGDEQAPVIDTRPRDDMGRFAKPEDKAGEKEVRRRRA